MRLQFSVALLLLSSVFSFAQPYVRVANTLADALASDMRNPNTNIYILGRATAGDNGHGILTWMAGSSETTNRGTVFTATRTGAPSGRFVRKFDGPVNTAWFGAFGNGVSDNLSALIDCFNVASNTTRQVVFGPASGGYVVSDQLLVNGVDVDLRGNTVIFSLVGNKYGFRLQSNSRLRNGYVKVLASALTATGGDFQSAVMIGEAYGGSGTSNVGYTNVVVDNVCFGTSRTNGVSALVMSKSSNVKFLNCSTFEAGPDMELKHRIGINIEAGTDGVQPPALSTHPHNISIENFLHRTNLMSGSSSVECAIYVSGAYAVNVKNVVAEHVAGTAILYSTTSDYGFVFAEAGAKQVANQGIVFDGIIGKYCAQAGVIIDGDSDNIGVRYSVPITLQNSAFYGAGSTYNGLSIARGGNIRAFNNQFVNFADGARIDDYSANIHLVENRFLSNRLTGITVSATQSPRDILLEANTVANNDQSAGGNPGIQIGQSLRTVARGNLIGNETNELTQTIGLRVNTAAVYADILDNKVLGAKAGASFGYVLAQGGDYYNTVWRFSGNQCVTGITMRTGLTYVPVNRRISERGIINTDLITGETNRPPDGTWYRGDTLRIEMPNVVTNVVPSMFVMEDGSPGTWVPDHIFDQIEDTQAELKVGKRLRVDGEFVVIPGTPWTLTASSNIVTDHTFIFVAGNGGPVTLTSTPTIADGFEGQLIWLSGTNNANLITIQDEAILPGSNVELLSGTTLTISNGFPVPLIFDNINSKWTQTYPSGVSSVGLTVPGGFAVSGSPVNGAGTLSITTSGSQPYYFLRGNFDGSSTWDNSLIYSNANDTVSAVMGIAKRGRAGDATGSPASGGILGQYRVGGWNTAGYVLAGGFSGFATEAWTASANGHQLRFYVVSNTTAVTSLALTLDQDGGLIPFISAAPRTETTAKLAFDSNAMAASRGALQIHDGTSTNYIVAFLGTDTPANGEVLTFNTGGGITWETPSAGTSGYVEIQDEGVATTQRTTANFIGPSVTAVDNSGASKTDVTIWQTPAGGTNLVSEARQITTAGAISGGGALSADLALALTTSPAAAATVVGTGRIIATSEGIQGGGDLSANRTHTLDINGLAADTTPNPAADFVATYDVSAGAHRKVRLDQLMGGQGVSITYRTKTMNDDVETQMWTFTPSADLVGFGAHVRGIIVAKSAALVRSVNVEIHIAGYRDDNGDGGAGSGTWVITQIIENEQAGTAPGILISASDGGTFTGALSALVRMQIDSAGPPDWTSTSIQFMYTIETFGTATVTFH